MGVKVYVLADLELLGEYEFQLLPRVGETISLPTPYAPAGFRSYDVEDVEHYPAGLDQIVLRGGRELPHNGPATVLAVDSMD